MLLIINKWAKQSTLTLKGSIFFRESHNLHYNQLVPYYHRTRALQTYTSTQTHPITSNVYEQLNVNEHFKHTWALKRTRALQTYTKSQTYTSTLTHMSTWNVYEQLKVHDYTFIDR